MAFAAIPGFPGYCVSDGGVVYSRWMPRRRILTKQWRALRPGVNSCGYKQVALYLNGQRFYLHVARLVLEAFVGPCPYAHEVRHLNSRRSDNRLVNLAWGTKSENAHDREAARRSRKNQ